MRFIAIGMEVSLGRPREEVRKHVKTAHSISYTDSNKLRNACIDACITLTTYYVIWLILSNVNVC